jgi:hypothetical protein
LEYDFEPSQFVVYAIEASYKYVSSCDIVTFELPVMIAFGTKSTLLSIYSE